MFKRFLSAAIVLGLSAVAFAGDYVPFTQDAFEKAKAGNEKILLHFHADWCPTCKAQSESLATLQKDGTLLKSITLFKVDYDKETVLKKALHVTHQATFVSFYGSVETGRETGVTSPEGIRAYVEKTLTSLTLKDQLAFMKRDFEAKVPPEKRKVMQDSIDQLKASKLEEKALKVGQKFPDFTLPNSSGKPIHLRALLKSGPVIVSFYRGSWCPYCNAQLSSFQQHLGEFKSKGATLVAITPEKPDLETFLKEGKKLEFDILNDKNNQLATKLGLVFGLTPELKAIYQQFGIDLTKTQGNPDWKLPVPATYVIGKNGKVVFEFLDVDYTHRADPVDILKALDVTK
jgi:peroxiredoxin